MQVSQGTCYCQEKVFFPVSKFHLNQWHSERTNLQSRDFFFLWPWSLCQPWSWLWYKGTDGFCTPTLCLLLDLPEGSWCNFTPEELCAQGLPVRAANLTQYWVFVVAQLMVVSSSPRLSFCLLHIRSLAMSREDVSVAKWESITLLREGSFFPKSHWFLAFLLSHCLGNHWQ